MEKAMSASLSRNRTRSIAFVALAIAIIAASAWVTVPIGPIPFTLQNFAISFALLTLRPKQALAAIGGYLVLGAIGLPVFSGMRGGIGVILGPTGGFLWGYLVGGLAVIGILALGRKLGGVKKDATESAAKGGRVRQILVSAGWEVVAMLVLIAIIDTLGCLQYMALFSVDFMAAFLVCAAPFLVVDLGKAIAAIVCSQAVRNAVGR